MARAGRVWVDGGIYHVFSRGSNRQAIVMHHDDYVDLQGILFDACHRLELDVFAWSLMPNHWHGLVRSPTEGLSRFMRAVNHRHSLRFNRRWQRTAHLFENRFGCVLQESEEQFLWTTRYIVRNPVEANIVASPVDTEWSSYRATVGRAPAPGFLRVDGVLAPFGGDRASAVLRFEQFVRGDREVLRQASARPPTAALVS